MFVLYKMLIPNPTQTLIPWGSAITTFSSVDLYYSLSKNPYILDPKLTSSSYIFPRLSNNPFPYFIIFYRVGTYNSICRLFTVRTLSDFYHTCLSPVRTHIPVYLRWGPTLWSPLSWVCQWFLVHPPATCLLYPWHLWTKKNTLKAFL